MNMCIGFPKKRFIDKKSHLEALILQPSGLSPFSRLGAHLPVGQVFIQTGLTSAMSAILSLQELCAKKLGRSHAYLYSRRSLHAASARSMVPHPPVRSIRRGRCIMSTKLSDTTRRRRSVGIRGCGLAMSFCFLSGFDAHSFWAAARGRPCEVALGCTGLVGARGVL